MNILKPQLMNAVPMPGNPSSLSALTPRVYNAEFYNAANTTIGGVGSGTGISALGDIIGSESAVRAGRFEDTMLRALDKVSAYQQNASSIAEAAILDPDSIDAHDVAIAQAEASMALNITRTILNRIVQSWKDLINTR
jgi:flagellar hook-basal body complex protein FliE